MLNVKVKAIPFQTWTGPEGPRKLRAPDIKRVGTSLVWVFFSCLGVFNFCTCYKILICIMCIVASFKLSFM